MNEILEQDIEKKDLLGLIADLYDNFRPQYPIDAAGLVLQSVLSERDQPSGTICDVGCGTGIFTRELAKLAPRKSDVVGVEPNSSMRARATASSRGEENIRYLAGAAEAIPLDDNTCQLVVAATAASWFRRADFFKEARRLLRRGGMLAIVQNRRRYQDSPLLADLESVLEGATPGYRRGTHYDPNGGFKAVDYASELVGTGSFQTVTTREIRWTQHLTPTDFVNLAMTLTVAQEGARRIGSQALRNEIISLVGEERDGGGSVSVPYVTEITMARPLPNIS